MNATTYEKYSTAAMADMAVLARICIAAALAATEDQEACGAYWRAAAALVGRPRPEERTSA